MLARGQGYRAAYGDYRLFVEAGDEVWQVRVHHLPSKTWPYLNSVDGLEAGKTDAITTAVLSSNPCATSVDIAVAKSSLTWERYGPKLTFRRAAG
jgi:hypothetical protein